jgi:hypothetical protein
VFGAGSKRQCSGVSIWSRWQFDDGRSTAQQVDQVAAVIVNAPQSPAIFFYDTELDATVFPLIIQHSLLMKPHNQYIKMFHCRDGSCQAIDRQRNVSFTLISNNKTGKALNRSGVSWLAAWAVLAGAWVVDFVML